MKEEFENGFIKHNKINIVEVNEKTSILEVEIDSNSLNPYGFVHGGLLFGTTDTGMGVICRYGGRDAVTVSSSIEYIKPATGSKIICKSEILKKGKTICHCQSKLYNEKDELVASVIGTYFYINENK